MALDVIPPVQTDSKTEPTTPGASLKSNPPKAIATPNQCSSSYRLLYRGALSLPDSHLLLDGLTFSARLDSPSKHTKSYSLLENPLALALESMRGRPSLRLQGIVKLADIYMDETGNVELDIHPRAMLSRIYFENTFCLKPFSSSDPSQLNTTRSDFGVKVALGDSDGPETTQIIIYAQVKPSTTIIDPNAPSTSANPIPAPAQTIRLCVGRITQRPQPKKRLPRPDDPIPRKPPILFAREIQRAESKGSLAFAIGTGKIGKVNELKRVGSGSFAASANGVTKRPKLVGGTSSSNDVFKVPEVPHRQSKGKEKAQDVFGDVAEVQNGKGKGKAPVSGQEAEAAALEKANKSEIKKATIAYLAQTKDPTRDNIVVDKKHPEWKDLYGYVYRGVCFAIRNRMKTETVDGALVDRLLKTHVKLYLSGRGPPDSSNTVSWKLPAQSSSKAYQGSSAIAVTGTGTTQDPIVLGR
ncbi:hypothetical protein CC1G_04512 [Coprinopsis cinerea okayama7|uniref:Sld7 C-terminal domain-containing protein n=1 Tax=Coprinopsis cinerea (strain Okayama-7 / 130 / ATCC MYA-4618 / FGSC 9003) TaxID=240176 RepID=A8N5D4_COPC7|nr:hypothetical protein CC1G_04512 [Coprinopsis cinerea okayama7\|eukprot:XP_001830079.2 hypothetical protein CC1G_04512 [Coprinopsis cinerea okayama7\